MSDTFNRTVSSSVVFADLVGYSKLDAAGQAQAKERFVAALSETLTNVPPAERIVLDAGSAAVIAFLGAPEDALLAALSLRDHYRILRSQHPQDAIRIGISRGALAMTRDTDGQPSVAGDGIALSQSVMGLSRAGQISVTRSYYDAVSRVSSDYAQLFDYEGARATASGEQQEIYVVRESDPAFARVLPPRESAPPPAAASAAPTATATTATSEWQGPRTSMTTWIVAGVALAVAGVLAVAWNKYSARRALHNTVAVAPKPAPAPQLPSTPPSVEPNKPAEVPPADTKTASTMPGEPDKNDPSKPTPGKPGEGLPPLEPGKEAEAKKPVPVSTGTIVFRIDPWGDVYIDGRSRGTAPPRNRMTVEAGTRRVEIRNTTFYPHIETVDVEPGQTVTIRHKFQ